MSHFLIVGPENQESHALRDMLPGQVLQLETLAGQRATPFLARASAVILNFPEALVCARVAWALHRAESKVRVFAVSRDWPPEEQEEALAWGVEACLSVPLAAEVVSRLVAGSEIPARDESATYREIQYRHGYPGRHLGSLDQPGF